MKVWLSFLAAFLLAPLTLRAQTTTLVQPDCFIAFTFTSGSASFPATPTNNGPGDNRQKGCSAWTMKYQSSGYTGVSVQVDSGASINTTVSFGAFAGIVVTGVNPTVSNTGGEETLKNGTAAISWVRVTATVSGAGTLTGVLYGWRNTSAAINNNGGSVTSVSTGCFLTGGPITTSGTIKASETVNSQTSQNYTYQNGDCGKLVTHSNSMAIAGTLPQANGATFVAGWFMDVQNVGAGTLTITPTVSTIDGASSLALTTGQGVHIVSDGANYFTERGIGIGGSILPCANFPALTGDVTTSAGSCNTAIGALRVTNAMLAGSILTAKLAAPTGTGIDVATSTAAGVSGNCASWTAAGNVGDSGNPCAPPNASFGFTTQTSVTMTHNLGTRAIVVQCFDGSNVNIDWNTLTLTSTNVATVTFTNPQTGTCVIAGSGGGGGGGGGSGTVDSGTAPLLTYYAANGTTVDPVAAPGGSIGVASGGNAILQGYTNNGGTGTVTNKLAKLSAANTAIRAATTDTEGMIGICASGCTTSGTGQLAIAGTAACVFDGATTFGHWVQISSSVAGDCTDAGASLPTTGQIIGQVLSTNGGAGTYNVAIQFRTAVGSGTSTVLVVTGHGNHTGNASIANEFFSSCDSSGGVVTLTLPASPTTGEVHNVKKIDSSANACTLSGNGKNVDGNASMDIVTTMGGFSVYYEGTQWYIIGIL